MKKVSILSFVLLITVGLWGQKLGTSYTPVVIEAVYFDVSPPLKDNIILSKDIKYSNDDKKEVPNIFKDKTIKKVMGTLPIEDDPVWQKEYGTKGVLAPVQNFEGVRTTDNSVGISPPDTDGDVGPNHYFQMSNLSFQIFNKTGTTLAGPAANNTLWAGMGEPWQSTNDGDPIVLYDEQADRWMATQFSVSSSPYGILIAISQTPDPTGTWFRYAFEFTDFPDYPKFGIWRDGYYMMVQHGTGAVTAAVFERDQMLLGAEAQGITFNVPNLPGGGFIGMLPSDNDGPWAPVGTPNYFMYYSDDAWGDDPVDRLKIWEFTTDWITPGNSTLILTQNLDTDPFDSYFGAFADAFIEQPGTIQNLAALEGALMNRLQYRNFGAYETMVTCHTVDVDGAQRAGTRWYELRKPTGGSWFIYQQGTYSPGTNDNHWMGSMAMNGSGDIALGYSVSGPSTYPSIRYTGRNDGDPLGFMTNSEGVIMNGSFSQTGTRRWGDYSAMSVDPSDDETFWYTNEYVFSSGWSDWVTQIASFEIVPPGLNANFTASSNSAQPGNTITYSDVSTGPPISWEWSFPGGIPNSHIGQTPPPILYNSPGTYNVSLTVGDGSITDTELKSDFINIGYCQDIEVNILTDDYGSETTWEISDVATGSVLISGGPYANNTNYVETVCLLNGCYTFTIYDSYGDGICCSYGIGSYSVTNLTTSEVYGSGGEFGTEESVPFCVEDLHITMDLKAFLEGPFNGTNMNSDIIPHIPLSQPFNISPWNYTGTESVGSIPANVVDWVLVDVRDAASAATATSATSVGKQAAFILNDGSIVGLDGSSNLIFDVSISQNLFVVVWHRNHLGVMSNSALSPVGGLYTYDYTTGINQVFGGIDGHKQISIGIWGMIGGDGNHDGVINVSDKSTSWENEAGEKGYINSDHNLDGESNNKDKDDIWVPNEGKSSQVPN